MIDALGLMGLAFALEVLDNSLGGGFGTILAPVLIILGYDPKIIVPGILVSEAVSGLWGGAWHFKYKNVNLKAVALTLIGSLAAMALASIIIGYWLPSTTIKQVICTMAIGMGIFVVIRSYYLNQVKPHTNHPWLFSALGFLIGFNKGGSGGNYGPISVTGYMLLGLSAATAIGTTTVAEGVACVLGVAIYSQATGIVLAFALPITLGAFVADPISADLNNKLKERLSKPLHTRLIGFAMMGVGLVALIKALGFL